MFPAVDVLRLAMRWPTANQLLCHGESGDKLLQLLLAWLRDSTVPTVVHNLSLRVLCNASQHMDGRSLLLRHRADILTISTTAVSKISNVQVNVATLLINYAVITAENDDAEATASVLSTAAAVWPDTSEPEALFRLLVTVGTCVSGNQNAREVAKSYGLVKCVSACRKVMDPAKVKNCARQLTDELLM